MVPTVALLTNFDSSSFFRISPIMWLRRSPSLTDLVPRADGDARVELAVADLRSATEPISATGRTTSKP